MVRDGAMMRRLVWRMDVMNTSRVHAATCWLLSKVILTVQKLGYAIVIPFAEFCRACSVLAPYCSDGPPLARFIP